MAAQDMLRLSADAVRAFAVDLLVAAGLPASDAATVAGCLVRADLRSVETHGVVRLPVCINRVRRGRVNRAPALAARRTSGASARVDGGNGLGFVVAADAANVAIDLAREVGVGLVGVSGSSHFGVAADDLLAVAEAGYGANLLTNAAPALPPWGGRTAMFGTNPFGAAVPLSDRAPFVLDMSTSVVFRGRIRQADGTGRPLPLGTALDPGGRSTMDAAAALRGVVLPVGGAKGAGLAMWIDLLCGALTGAGFAGGVADQHREPERP